MIISHSAIQNDRESEYCCTAAGGARAGVLAEEDDDEGAQGGRRCGRAARSPMLSARFRIADDVYYKDHPSLPTSDLSGSCARACRAERPRA